ncbi:MAG: cell envelope integrity protein CreD [Helicobacteraceae bacterium]|jgi:inner membrane protein|nr:cell envelope integrity protein CreD [Helicobacteraceae bacterium]
MSNQTVWKKFSGAYTFRVLLLIFLILIILIPLGLITSIVEERSLTAAYAEQDIMAAWGGSLVEAGPVIAIPAVRNETIVRETEDGKSKVERVNTPFTFTIAPKNLTISTNLKTEIRKRGIFSVPLFYGTLTLKGSFDPALALEAAQPKETLNLSQAEIVVYFGDLKGIRAVKSAKWGDRELFFQPTNRPNLFYGSKAIFAALKGFENKEITFEISFDIQGGQSLRFIPIAQNTEVSVASDWGSPSFQGSFLPIGSHITEESFSAEWNINYLSREIPLFWRDGVSLNETKFGVDFYRAIDTYSLNTRAVKYAVLIVIVPFLTLFLLEIVAKVRIHPVPYLLCGIGNAVFYLLLLSLSEQIAFYAAYFIAAAAVIALLALYARSLLPTWTKAGFMGFAAMLSYLLLYAVLNAESYALLIGSLVTFATIALVMFLTRNLDWYGENS